MRGVRIVWVVLAVLCDVAAVVGLVMVAIGGYLHANVLGLIYFGAMLGLLAVLGAIFSTVVVVSAARSHGVRMRLVVPVVSVLCALSLAIGPAAIVIGWRLTPNPAVDHIDALRAEIEKTGGSEICSNRDPGLGPDNTTPWSDVWYRVPVTDVHGELFGEAIATSAAGRDLGLTPVPVDLDTPGVLGLSSPSHTPGDFTVEVEIITQSTPLRCSGVDGYNYGDPFQPDTREVTVVLHSSRVD
ncbi:hypothetical protein [Cryobacterium sp. MDB2-33-2]|uniref:hypothetical protein n=1 Tax=Cryobacterium sp. MDB2-33-2 TaxID=1259179 RepID=UPI00106BE5E6|nr:hypothetical protein [Cryobacterium sp. MDB2-33-2]TFC06529.1 hypothetical protein E3O59_10155 [Cryobacterium sp. MDB2-33-2]